jgi:autotransporter-associated beta strand protein
MQQIPPPQKYGCRVMSLLDRGSSANIAAAAVSAALLSIIVPARGQRVLGLDVSTWQGNLSTTTWATFKRPTDQQVSGVFGDGRDFVMIRSSRGGTTGEDHRQGGYPSGNNTFYNLSQRYDDPYFVQNINRATTAGMFAGSYHFARADILASTLNSDGVTTAGVANNGTDEADHFIQMAGVWMRPGYLLPALDLEAGASQHTTAELSSFAVAFSDRIYQQMGIRPMIYVNSSYANSEVNSTVAATFPILWIARPSTGDPLTTEPPPALPTYPNVYGVWNPSYPTIPTPQPWKFWQYDSGGGLNGYSGNIDKNAANGGMEFLKDYLVPAIWVTNSDGQWTTQTNWNSGQTPVLPVTGAGQIAPIGTQTLPTPRLPGSEDTVILDRPSANIIVTLDSGTHTIRKLYMREALNITGGSLTIGYVPSSDSTPIAAQFSGPVSLSGSASLSVHTLQVDATQTFTLGGGALTFNTINLMPHSTTPAKLLVTGDVSFSGLASISATIANGTGSGSSGLVDLGGATRTLDVANVVSGIDLSVNVPVTNGAIIKAGTGTLGLAAANTYTGGTAIQAGRIELSGSLNSGVTVNSGGVLALGTSTGIRTVNGGLAVNAGGTFRVHINGTTAGSQYDQLRLTNGNSTATLGGTLDLIAVAGLASGSTFRILDISPSTVAVSGTFAGLPQNAEFYEDSQWWRISYTGGTGNDVELTRITPTPWQTWQLTNFPNDVNNSAIVGASVDIEGDGLVNLLEYTFGGNPSVASPTSLPQVSMLGGRLALTFTRVVANTDLTITVQGADNAAGPWTSLAASVNGGVTAPLGAATVTETGSGATRSVEVRDLYLTTDPMHPKRFMKVQVTKQ